MTSHAKISLTGVLLCLLSSALAWAQGRPDIQPYRIALQVIDSGFDGQKCWFHPRATTLGNSREGILLMQYWYSLVSDLFSPMYDITTRDGGAHWSPARNLSATVTERTEGSVTTRICDLTPMYHPQSGKVLATGHNVRYRDNKLIAQRSRDLCWMVYDPPSGTWTDWQILEVPPLPEFYNIGNGCGQQVLLPDGDILIPVYFKPENATIHGSTVIRCSFDGTTLRYKSHGNYLEHPVARGLYEPSLIEFKGRFYITLRNDINGFVSASRDGLQYAAPQEWTFDDGAKLNSKNTQQHWAKSGNGLFLVYTRTGAGNDNVIRGRAPLFMAQVDTARLCLIRASERIIVPNNGAQLGNFGVNYVNDRESWITTSEGTTSDNLKYGANGRLYLARILWGKKR